MMKSFTKIAILVALLVMVFACSSPLLEDTFFDEDLVEDEWLEEEEYPYDAVSAEVEAKGFRFISKGIFPSSSYAYRAIRPFLGWEFFPVERSEDGKIVIGYAINEDGFDYGDYHVDAGTKVGVFWRIGKIRWRSRKITWISSPKVLGVIPDKTVDDSYKQYKNFYWSLRGWRGFFNLEKFDGYMTDASSVEVTGKRTYEIAGLDQDEIPAIATLEKWLVTSIVSSGVNEPPVADAGLPQSVATGSLVTLDGSGSYDPEAAPLFYSWEITLAPAGSTAVLAGADTAEPTFTPNVGGDYEIELTVSDGSLSATDTATVTSIVNEPPVADAGLPQSVATGSLVTLDGSGSYDPEAAPLIFSWAITLAPAGSTAGLAGADTATPTFTPDIGGSYEVELAISDGFETATDTVAINAATFDISNADVPDVNGAYALTAQVINSKPVYMQLNATQPYYVFFSNTNLASLSLWTIYISPSTNFNINGSYPVDFYLSEQSGDTPPAGGWAYTSGFTEDPDFALIDR